MDSKQASQVTWGLVVVAIGLILLAGQVESGWVINFGRLWPLIFVILGVGKLLGRDARGSVWFLFLGGIFLLHTYRVMPLSRSWPLFIVLAGISMLFPKREAMAAPTPLSNAENPPEPPRFPDGRLQP